MDAQAYCSNNFTKFSANGTLSSFQNQSDWNNIRGLIKTLEYTGTAQYWTGLKFNKETNSYNFSDGTNATFATGLGIIGAHSQTQGKCVVATKSPLKLVHLSCSQGAYFICKITINNVNTPGIYYIIIIYSKVLL
jgi:hypothetical protein